jgi:hypothetical protein
VIPFEKGLTNLSLPNKTPFEFVSSDTGFFASRAIN